MMDEKIKAEIERIKRAVKIDRELLAPHEAGWLEGELTGYIESCLLQTYDAYDGGEEA